LKSAGGVSKIKFALEEFLDSPDIERIGMILDENESGVDGRIEMINSILTKKNLNKVEADWQTWESNNASNKLTVAVWVMPDNNSERLSRTFPL